MSQVWINCELKAILHCFQDAFKWKKNFITCALALTKSRDYRPRESLCRTLSKNCFDLCCVSLLAKSGSLWTVMSISYIKLWWIILPPPVNQSSLVWDSQLHVSFILVTTNSPDKGPLLKRHISLNFSVLNNFILQGSVVQSWISANPGLKFNPLFWFVYFCTYVFFQNFTKEDSY
jgi:hypothetical protein